jgi:nitrite reductase/ring-hydroxylating ferredoxin subunit/uncharacterized membrane protein
MHRQITAFIDRQAPWADQVADWAQPLIAGLFEDRRPLKNALNGTWFGHPVHPALTDVPMGAMTLAALFDLTGHDDAADAAVATGIAGMAAAAVTGAADAVDAQGKPRTYASVHAMVMSTSLGVYALSFLLRLGPRFGRPTARLLAYLGYGVLTAGAYVGGDLVYRAGNQVDRHAFEGTSAKWRSLDVSEVPAGKLVKAKAGIDTLVLYRELDGDPISALHAVCSHAGGPLDKGEIVDGCVQCPWHGSRFDLETGHVRQGPAVYDQPRFEVRESPDGGLQARRMREGAGEA